MSAPFFKKLFQPGGALESLVIKLPIPNTVSDLSPKGIALRLRFNWCNWDSDFI